MKACLILLALLTGLQSEILSQPFDTLLLQYNYLNEIYPLDDGSFILVGSKDGIVVERINAKAESIWTTRLGAKNETEAQCAIHLNDSDSSIQIQTISTHCDLTGDGTFKVFTLTLDGIVTDSAFVSNAGSSLYCSLLSGDLDLPRFAYFKEKKVILQFQGGDTLELSLLRPEDDSIISSFTGPPRLVNIFPYGDILVGTTSNFIWYKRENSKYVIYNRTFSAGAFGASGLFCFSDSTHVLVNTSGLIKYKGPYRYSQFFPADNYYAEIRWQGNNFLLKSSALYGKDSVFLLDQNLDLIYKHPTINSDQIITSYAINGATTFFVGTAYATWIEGGFLGSINHNTGGGPKFYDVSLLDYNLSKYDSFEEHRSCVGYNYKFNFPEVKFTIQNNADFPISQTTILFSKICFCPAEGTWLRTIDNMDLAPGETKTYSLYDVKIESQSPFYDPIYLCFGLLRPDNHADDNTWPGNSLCKDSEIESARPFEDGERIRFYPNPVQDQLNILTSNQTKYGYQLYNANGTQIDTRNEIKGGPNQIDMTDLAPGIYLIRFVFEDGHEEALRVLKV